MSRDQWQHLYNLAAWVVLRKWRLSTEPLCRMCLEIKRVTPATVVDHIKEHKGEQGDPEAFSRAVRAMAQTTPKAPKASSKGNRGD